MTDSETMASPRLATGPRQRGWLRHPATLAVGGFLVIRALGLLVLLWSPARGRRSLVEVLGIWDGGWYVRISQSGYADHLDLSAPLTDQSTGSLAFFPGYPMLMRLLSEVTGLDPRWAGVVISLFAGAVAAAGIAILARDWASSERVGVLAGLLWACAPMAAVSALVYSEALFTALAVWTFVALRRHSWGLAAGLAVAAGLTRPTGIAVGTAVAAYAAWTWRQSWHRPRQASEDGSDRSVLPLVAGTLALIATPAFWFWVGVRAGRWEAWFAVQKTFWGSYFDGGASMLTLARTVVLGQAAPGLAVLSTAVLACLLVAGALLVLAIRGRAWWPLLVYAVISMVMVIGSAGYFSSKLRFLVPIFVLAFPLARWLGQRSVPVQALAVLAAVAATTVSGTWILLVWPYAI
ncbi:MAG: hypothetical protein H0T54_10420 [Geodermatophilaceae bacterium]|nr:hypothetical protein [Geodermatophilaceae bacterium]